MPIVGVLIGRYERAGIQRLCHDIAGIIAACDLDLVGYFQIGAVGRVKRSHGHCLGQVGSKCKDAESDSSD